MYLTNRATSGYRTAVPGMDCQDGPDLGSGHHTLLVRRNDTTGELAW